MYFFAGVLGLIAAGLMLVFAGGLIFSAPRYTGPESDHFDGKRFVNYDNVQAQGGTAVLRWMMNRKRGPWKSDFSKASTPHPLTHFRGGIRITFVNHSTFLIQVDGINILTDPVWSNRVSPIRWAGPKRARLPGVPLEDLPPINAVAVSHNHYDHLDEPTLRILAGAHHPQIVVPLGVKSFLEKKHIGNGVELDWWEEHDLGNGVTITAVPAQHFSGRGLFDRDATLWCGYVIKTSAGAIYFAGDTGYNSRMFQDIRRRLGPVRVALLPIGAYKPQWFMSPIHTSPAEAVQIHRELGAEKSIATHFGTFPLADDGQQEPVSELKAALAKSDVSDDDFLILGEGWYYVIE